MVDESKVKGLLDHICNIPTVDAHEHLHAEEMRLGRKVDIFLLFHQYLFTQLIAAGMDAAKAQALESEDVSPDAKWDSVAPYLDLVRLCGCARPPFEALNRFFGEEDLTAANYQKITDRMRAHNAPGLFDRCLRKACNIALVLNQNRTMWQNELFKPILPEDNFIGMRDRPAIEALSREVKAGAAETLPQLVEQIEALLERHVRAGMIGVKGMAFPYTPGHRDAAASAYGRIIAGGGDNGDRTALADYLRDQLYEMCARLQIVVVKHSGVWAGGWSDHTTVRPTNIIPVALRHRQTRFDLFHAGTPWPEDAGLIGRSFPNIWINLCWSHLLSPVLSERALDLWLDIMPINRVIIFGGDYWWAVENVYGALKQTREIAARVLERRMSDGGLTEARALDIARRWFHDNARECYRV